jgi:hypothetical protein
MKPLKKPKYKISLPKIIIKKEEEFSPEELYRQQLHSKTRLKRR